jgi:hypothetical protein
MIKIDTSGLEELKRKLKKIEENGEKLEGQNSVPFTEVFPVEFMKKYTEFSSIDDMFNKSPFKIDSDEDFAAIDDKKWDDFIKTSTKFQTWEKMQEEAAVEWTKKQLGF